MCYIAPADGGGGIRGVMRPVALYVAFASMMV